MCSTRRGNLFELPAEKRRRREKKKKPPIRQKKIQKKKETQRSKESGINAVHTLILMQLLQRPDRNFVRSKK
jgi:hypothetical protein